MQNGNDTNIFDDEIVALCDKLMDYNSSTKTQLKNISSLFELI